MSTPKDLSQTFASPDWNEMDETITALMRQDKMIELGKPILEKFRKSKDSIGNRVEEIDENMAFYEGKQYELSKYKNSRPWVVRMKTPYASTAIDTRVSSLIADDYIGVLYPMRPEDEEPVQIMGEIIRDEWQRENVDAKIKQAIKNSAIIREGYLHVITRNASEKGFADGRDRYIAVEVIDRPSSIMIDPSALKLSTANYVMVTSRITYSDAIKEYPVLEGILTPSQSGLGAHDRGETNYSSKDYNTNQDDVCTRITYYDYDDEGKVRKAIMIEDMMVKQDTLSGLTTFPIAQLRWKKEHSSPYGRSLMDELLEIQKAINAIESSLTNTAVAYSAPSYAIRKGVGINAKQFAKYAGAPGFTMVVDGDPAQAFRAIPFPEISQAVTNVKDQYIGAIDQIAGITNPYLGSIGTAGNTAQGARLTMERARIIEADVLANIAEFVEDITDILVEYLSASYRGEELITRDISDKENRVNFKSRTLPSTINELKYSFYINLNSKTSYSREREKEKLSEIFQMQDQYDTPVKAITLKDLIIAYDFENSDSMLATYDSMTEEAMVAKLEVIAKIQQSGAELGIDEALIQGACLEIMMDVPEEKQVMLPQFTQAMQMKEQEAMAMEQQLGQLEAMADERIAGGEDETQVNNELIQMVTELMGQPQE